MVVNPNQRVGALSLNCEIAEVPEPPPKSSPQATARTQTKTSPIIVVGIWAIPIALLILIVSNSGGTSQWPPSPRSSYEQNVPSNSQSAREDAIDAFVDREVEEHWRPIAGGNSKEDAKILTGDILRARNWEELNAAVEKNIREGR